MFESVAESKRFACGWICLLLLSCTAVEARRGIVVSRPLDKRLLTPATITTHPMLRIDQYMPVGLRNDCPSCCFLSFCLSHSHTIHRVDPQESFPTLQHHRLVLGTPRQLQSPTLLPLSPQLPFRECTARFLPLPLATPCMILRLHSIGRRNGSLTKILAGCRRMILHCFNDIFVLSSG